MKLRLLIIFLSVTYTCFSQNSQHTKLPGTRCSMIPPPGFKPASGFSGFQDPSIDASIILTEIPGPFEEIAAGLTNFKLESSGVTVLSRDSMRVNNFPALFFTLRQPSGNGKMYKKQFLIFGNTSNTIMINGIYPESEKSIEVKIKESLLSTLYDSSVTENPLDAAPFILNVEGSGFKATTFIMGSLVYTIDGEMPTDKPTLMATSSIFKTTIGNKKQFAEDRFKKLPGANGSIIREINEIRIDGMDGFEIMGDIKSGIIYQVMLFSDSEEYFLIVGQANRETDKYLKLYKQIAKTFHRK